MHVQVLQGICGLNDDWCFLAFVEHLEELKNQDEDGLIFLPDELLDQH